jgi:peptidoglycan L-alanyl-D-glutamate endopeptidase CwlK
MEAISEQRLALVMPELADKIRAMSDSLLPQQIEIRVTTSLRTFAEQNILFAQRPKVTNAPGGYSMHNFGLAVDCVPDSVWGQPWTPDWDGKDVHYAKMVAAGVAQGLVAGADWHSFVDEPHFQWGGLPDTPTDAMRADFYAGGLTLVWQKTLAGDY